MLSPGEKLNLPITITNSNSATDVTLRSILPEGWKEDLGTAIYPIGANGSYTVQTLVRPPASTPPGWVAKEVVWKAESGGQEIGSIRVRVMIGSGGLPQ